MWRSLSTATLALVLCAGCQKAQQSPSPLPPKGLGRLRAESSIKSAFLQVAIAQEAYWNDHGIYKSSLSELGVVDDDSSVSIRILEATKNGWVGIGNGDEETSCVLFYGIPTAKYKPLLKKYEADEGVVACR
jgi:hypothetical protein